MERDIETENELIDLGSVTAETKGGAINLFSDGDSGYRSTPMISVE